MKPDGPPWKLLPHTTVSATHSCSLPPLWTVRPSIFEQIYQVLYRRTYLLVFFFLHTRRGTPCTMMCNIICKRVLTDLHVLHFCALTLSNRFQNASGKWMLLRMLRVAQRPGSISEVVFAQYSLASVLTCFHAPPAPGSHETYSIPVRRMATLVARFGKSSVALVFFGSRAEWQVPENTPLKLHAICCVGAKTEVLLDLVTPSMTAIWLKRYAVRAKGMAAYVPGWRREHLQIMLGHVSFRALPCGMSWIAQALITNVSPDAKALGRVTPLLKGLNKLRPLVAGYTWRDPPWAHCRNHNRNF